MPALFAEKRLEWSDAIPEWLGLAYGPGLDEADPRRAGRRGAQARSPTFTGQRAKARVEGDGWSGPPTHPGFGPRDKE
ncbi:MAG: hypothetical protein AB7J34_02405 [Limisphaerales bacterium]